MKKLLYLCMFLCGWLTACQSKKVETTLTITPYPNHIETKKGVFEIDNKTSVVLPISTDTFIQNATTTFITHLREKTHFSLPGTTSSGKNSIEFKVNNSISEEGYQLNISPNQVLIEASTAEGFFYATQSIQQLMPIAIYEANAPENTLWTLPCVAIDDAPRFHYRGMHLDVSRHFFSMDEVKRYLDIMAIYKLNKFHWHLTDDQGWRIEIKKYPRLTDFGSIRNKTMILKEWDQYDTTAYGGYYTQDEIKEIVAYAADRFITVIPEIDLPGHMMGALASYPYLGCKGKNYEVSGQWGVRDDVLCVGKESTFTFLEDVLSEVIELFPSEYIHIGGDECPKVRWKDCPYCQKRIKEEGLKGDDKQESEHYLQSYTIKRIEKFLNSKGRRIIGWDEILEGGLAPDATVMSWRGMEGGIEAAQQQHDVIMTPSSHVYFDYYQTNDTKNEPFSIGGCLPVKRVYEFEPVPAQLTSEEKKHIIGAQANLWTEYIPTNEQLEYQLLPRLAALSEVQWTNPENKNWSNFLTRLLHETTMYDLLGYNYAKHIFEIQGQYKTSEKQTGVEAILQVMGNAPIYYTLDGTDPTEESPVYKEPILITKSCTLKAITKHPTIQLRPLVKEFVFNKATGNKATFNQYPKEKYTYDGATLLTDGIRGDFNYANGLWLGFEDNPMDVTIEFKEPTTISSVKIGTLVQFGEYIFPPTKIEVFGAGEDGKFNPLAQTIIPVATKDQKDGLYEFGCDFDSTSVNKVIVKAYTTNPIPEWHGAHGEKAFIFVDEIIMN